VIPGTNGKEAVVSWGHSSNPPSSHSSDNADSHPSHPAGRPGEHPAEIPGHTDGELKVQIRWLIRRDMAEVLSIERSSFDQPWTEEDFLAHLRQRNCIGMVAEYNQQIVGFMIYELHKARLQLLNFAVSLDYRRLGIGQQMVTKLIDKLSQQRRQEILLEVRESNLEAQLFFKAREFRAVRVIRDHYDDTVEDAYVMRYRLYETASDTIPFQPQNRIAFYDDAA
tara:strand:+ start:2828 stop:3499 length:672 start_codon:yes stop_codon:yes gene_type:complete